LRIFDLANVRSVFALQTEDLARILSLPNNDSNLAGHLSKTLVPFQLLGRPTLAEPRGCSLMQVDRLM
jgi:hypothetical protein